MTVPAPGRYRLRPLLVLAFLLAAPMASACGVETDCMVGTRSYRLMLPAGHDDRTPTGALFFLHGYRGTSDGVMANAALRAAADRLGVAFVALQAMGDEWNAPNAPAQDRPANADEAAYLDAVVEDLGGRIALDRDRMLVAGFSSGAMMVWSLACARGDAFAGFVPVSGTFWAPVPEACPAAPLNLIHYHGTADEVVPLAGRAIGEARQGDVTAAVDMLTAAGGYGPPVPVAAEELDCTRRVDPGGHLLEICLFEGGHSLRPKFLERAWTLLAGPAP
jgi:polyhydroxybutyrate depolymerase